MSSITGSPARPIILASSMAAASVTGTLTETQLASITIPANLLGLNGSLRVTTFWNFTNSANTKTFRVRYSGSGGINVQQATTTNEVYVGQTTIMANNSVSSQKIAQGGQAGGWGLGTGALLTGSADTTVATSVYISGQLANVGETITLQGSTVEFIPGV